MAEPPDLLDIITVCEAVSLAPSSLLELMPNSHVGQPVKTVEPAQANTLFFIGGYSSVSWHPNLSGNITSSSSSDISMVSSVSVDSLDMSDAATDPLNNDDLAPITDIIGPNPPVPIFFFDSDDVDDDACSDVARDDLVCVHTL